MGLLQAAYQTYESQVHLLGREEVGKEMLTPVSHQISNAYIEITINKDGEFKSASSVPKKESKTIIPVTEKSANRTSKAAAHPLSDQLCYLAPFGEDKYALYLEQLEQWAGSKFGHPKVQAVLKYIKTGRIAEDLAQAGIIELDDNGCPAKGAIEGYEYAKCLVRWRVSSLEPTACWTDKSLFDSFAEYYKDLNAKLEKDICLISGNEDIICDLHPKGVVVSQNSAKLISSNDNANFTYRGRFTQPQQAYNIGYAASQKAHAALRWITANYGVIMGDRTFICWNPKGIKLPSLSFFGISFEAEEEPGKFVSYKKKLLETLSGYRQSLKPEDDVIIASLDAATTGRLSITYYNELKASDFLDRLEHWYETFCWSYGRGTQSPSLRQTINFAFGTQKNEFVEADAKILRDHIQRLLRCVVDKQAIPFDIVAALAARAGNLPAYSQKNRNRLVTTACAAVRKYYNDKNNREVWTLALDTSSTNRSYLFGRLLAAADLAEQQTYSPDEKGKRDTNAIRAQSLFSQRPMDGWKIIRESLIPYMTRLNYGSKVFYQRIIDEICDKLNSDDPEINKALDPVYLIGYSHQRTAIFTSGKAKNEEENENESAE